MAYANNELADVLRKVDLGSPVAEVDRLLETARVETSVFSDILHDRVDLVPGTKGSGKSALYRIFVDFLSGHLLSQRKVVIAHGVQVAGDTVFHVYNDRFGQLKESGFLDFWCIYLVSLAQEHFLKDDKYSDLLDDCKKELGAFRNACHAAKIPEIGKRKSLRDVLDWALGAVLSRVKPSVKCSVPGGVDVQFSLFGDTQGVGTPRRTEQNPLPQYVTQVKETLEAILERADLHLWLMIDRLDEIFPRRSDLEARALRGLLRTLRVFESPRIRVKIFLRDDILEHVTSGPQGFPALTHVTARRADKLQWSEEQILDLIVNRLFAADTLRKHLEIDSEKLSASRSYRQEAFYRVFPRTVHRGANQSETLRWIYNHTMDGRQVVTPRDVIDLLTRAKQRQQDDFEGDHGGTTDVVIGSAAIRYGLGELSRYKRDTLLKAEFPHFWPAIEKLCKGKTEYTEAAIRKVLPRNSPASPEDLLGIGVLGEGRRRGVRTFKIPFLYREGLEVTQGFVE